MRTSRRAAAAAVSLVVVAGWCAGWLGCSGDRPSGGSGGESHLTQGGCEVLDVRSGTILSADALARHNDPVSRFLLTQSSCPQNITEISKMLRENDVDATAASSAIDAGGFPLGGPVLARFRCPKPQFDGQTQSGLTTRFVTDRSQLLETPDTYRAVVTRQCGGRSDHELFISLFGISAHDPKLQNLPNSTELIGEGKETVKDESSGLDRTDSVFNFYAREANQWKFFGSSKDFVSNGYECNADGACLPKIAHQTRCAACHPGGGLNMKELQSPWLNWEGARDTPGTTELVAASPSIFGTKGTGIDLEAKVEAGNGQDWIPTRINTLLKVSAKEVLRPLFCTVDINLNATSQSLPSGIADRNLHEIGTSFFVDANFQIGSGFTERDPATGKATVFSGIQVNPGDYANLLVQDNQHISSGNATAARLRDTTFAFVFPRKSTQDETYIQQLAVPLVTASRSEGGAPVPVNRSPVVIDRDFMLDVLSIDLSRPAYSKARCDVLERYAPDLTGKSITPETLRAGFVATITAEADAGTVKPLPGAAELLASLQNPNDANAHRAVATGFIKACTLRSNRVLAADATDAQKAGAAAEKLAVLKDAVAYASHVRRAAKRARTETADGVQGIIEFSETLPVDDVTETTKALNPVDCTLSVNADLTTAP